MWSLISMISPGVYSGFSDPDAQVMIIFLMPSWLNTLTGNVTSFALWPSYICNLPYMATIIQPGSDFKAPMTSWDLWPITQPVFQLGMSWYLITAGSLILSANPPSPDPRIIATLHFSIIGHYSRI